MYEQYQYYSHKNFVSFFFSQYGVVVRLWTWYLVEWSFFFLNGVVQFWTWYFVDYYTTREMIFDGSTQNHNSPGFKKNRV